MTAIDADATMDNEGVRCRPQPLCMSCGAPGARIHEGLRDRIFGAVGTWSVRRCSNAACRLAWSDPQPLPDQIIKLYQTYYTHTAEPEEEAAPADEGAVTGWVSTGWKRPAKRIARALMPWRRLSIDTDLRHFGDRPPGVALDIGCGAGKHLKVLRAHGWRAIGIDFDPAAVAAAVRQGLDARVGDLAGCAFADGAFDGIYMDNVIEHLADPAAVLAECRRILKPKGRVVMITPNIDSFGHEIFGQDWRGLEIPRHIHIFSAPALARQAEKAGFGHVEVFPQLNAPWPARYIVEQSTLIAQRSGRVAPAADGGDMDRRATRGRRRSPPRAEWIICVAEK